MSLLGDTDTGVHLLTHELPTSGIVYFEMAFAMADLSLEHLRYLPLFCRLLVEGGTTSLSPEKLQHKIGALTGGLAASAEISTVAQRPRTVAEKFDAIGFVVLRGKVRRDWAGRCWAATQTVRPLLSVLGCLSLLATRESRGI